MIREFQGEYRFLSNFWVVDIEYGGLKFTSVEAAYRAQKTVDSEVRRKFQGFGHGRAKREGRKLTIRSDWEKVKVGIMTDLVCQKFRWDPLRSLLLNTGDCEIQEGNHWGDRCVMAHLKRGGSQNFSLEEVRDARVVCFTVPNGILVTRRNGSVAIQGNCKHAMHLVRLLRMGAEILETGEVIVYRPDRDELQGILRGEWSYERLEAYAEEMDAHLEELYRSSSLQNKPDRKGIEALYQEVCKEHYGIKL